MLQMLVWTVNTKYRTLDHDLPTPAVTGEVSAGKLSADGAVAEYEFVRFLPFDKETISNVSWECAKCDFGSAYSEIVRTAYTTQPPSRHDMTLIACCVYRRNSVLLTS